MVLAMDRYVTEAIVVGCGVVGLAAGRALASAGLETIVLDKEPRIAEHQSSRNSEVVHAGIYYAPGSAKARYCLAGKPLIYAYCRERGIKAIPIGKLVVATTEAEIPRLLAIRDNAHACGMMDIDVIPAADARRMEPDLHCVAALWSPTSGIIDSHAYMLSLQGDLENAGGSVVLNAPVERVVITGSGFDVMVGGDNPVLMTCKYLVNAGGLFAPALARAMDGYPASRVPTEGFARGNYYALGRKPPFRHLIYPVPEPGGLGVHLTLDLAGQARFGPDVEWIDRVDYAVSAAREANFYSEIRKYWPGLPDGALTASYAGIRAKIMGQTGPQDFIVEGPAEHGIAGLVQLFGIESPGLTSSLALAERVATMAMATPAELAVTLA